MYSFFCKLHRLFSNNTEQYQEIVPKTLRMIAAGTAWPLHEAMQFSTPECTSGGRCVAFDPGSRGYGFDLHLVIKSRRNHGAQLRLAFTRIFR